MRTSLALQSLVSNAKSFFGLSESSEPSTPPPPDSPLITIGKVYFLHLRSHSHPEDTIDTITPCGGATIAFRCVPDSYDHVGNIRRIEENPYYVIQMGVAHCRCTDIFNKRIGRDISTARLLAGDADVVTLRRHPTLREVINEARETYYLEKEIHLPTVRLMYR